MVFVFYDVRNTKRSRSNCLQIKRTDSATHTAFSMVKIGMSSCSLLGIKSRSGVNYYASEGAKNLLIAPVAAIV